MRTFIPLVAVSVFAAFACDSGRPGLSAFDNGVSEAIRKQCNFDGPCELTIGDATDFDWDEMYVFRPGLTPGDVEAILPAAKGFQGEFNRKIAFFRHGELVRLDEAAEIIEGEHTPPGMLFFDLGIEGNPDCLRYSRHTVFKVTQEKWSRGNVYRLACSNCTSSPVFAEFGASTEKSM